MESKNHAEINKDQAEILKILRDHPRKFLESRIPGIFNELWHMDLIRDEFEYAPDTCRVENGITFTDENTVRYHTFSISSKGKTALENYERANLALKISIWSLVVAVLGFISGVITEYNAGIVEKFLRPLG